MNYLSDVNLREKSIFCIIIMDDVVFKVPLANVFVGDVSVRYDPFFHMDLKMYIFIKIRDFLKAQKVYGTP